MFPPFSQELAHYYCQELFSLIKEGSVSLEKTGRESEERKNQGLMIGCLVCWDNNVGKRVLLFAVSGNNKRLITDKKTIAGCDFAFVPSIAAIADIEKALADNDKEIHVLTDAINSINKKTDPQRIALCEKRRNLTDSSLKKVFSLYTFTAFNGEKISLDRIIELHNGRLPPTGTGDCCAPKLLSYAFARKLMIISMDELYFGRDSLYKKNGVSYPPCDERCGYILPFIIGLNILYRDKDIIIINKPSGLLSVPGRGEEKQDCAESRVRFYYPDAPRQCAVHRLDMETSGILVLALNSRAHKKMNEQFAKGLVHKKYIALLDGILYGKPEGRTELPFRLDTANRPHQIYDKVNGKTGITEWKKLGVELVKKSGKGGESRKVTRIEFSPLTGRTHQLRLAASCPVELGGLGIPIAGDSLYGGKKAAGFSRLLLHASEITFSHPTSGRHIHLLCPPDF